MESHRCQAKVEHNHAHKTLAFILPPGNLTCLSVAGAVEAGAVATTTATTTEPSCGNFTSWREGDDGVT